MYIIKKVSCEQTFLRLKNTSPQDVTFAVFEFNVEGMVLSFAAHDFKYAMATVYS